MRDIEGEKVLLIDFKKNKLQSVKAGYAIVLKTVGDKGIELLRLINKKKAAIDDNSGTDAAPAAGSKPAVPVYPKYFDSVKKC
ncbi:hypothetical protein [Paraflavitalea speifideaquila]|uniref:hypothetical protein n=1 Tax=Paraflavitalea speifideaquila TaxID=3076558 RepID=UPI0028E2AB14|nr:hypothetical protein [Paraflavitalea speifideiaquila]